MRFVTLLVLVSASLCAGLVRAGELEERTETMNEARKYFLEDNYAKLDELTREYRTRKTRTASGVWKLSLLHAALEPQSLDEAQVIDDLTLAWSKNSPSNPTAQVAHAHALIRHGWQYRGGGYAGEVSRENGEAFIRYNKLAEAYLLKVKDTASMDPQWYAEMLSVGTNLGWHSRRILSLVSEAAVREPGYYPTYFQAVTHLMPKWHGDAAQVATFVDAVVARTVATEGASMYARMFWVVQGSNFEQNVFESYGANWDRMDKAFSDLIARYPAPFNISAYAQFACLAGDVTKYEELKAMIPGEGPAMYLPEGNSGCAI